LIDGSVEAAGVDDDVDWETGVFTFTAVAIGGEDTGVNDAGGDCDG